MSSANWTQVEGIDCFGSLSRNCCAQIKDVRELPVACRRFEQVTFRIQRPNCVLFSTPELNEIKFEVLLR
jgi:hypothetical protein